MSLANNTTELQAILDAINALPDKTTSVPVESTSEEDMNALLETAEVGSVFKYTGATTDTFENGAYYIVEEE